MQDKYSDLTSKQIIRNFQLYLLSDIPLEEPYLSIYNDLEKIFSDLNIYTSDDVFYSKFIFYGRSKDDLYICYDGENGDVMLDYRNVWSFLKGDMGSHTMIYKGLPHGLLRIPYI